MLCEIDGGGNKYGSMRYGLFGEVCMCACPCHTELSHARLFVDWGFGVVYIAPGFT